MANDELLRHFFGGFVRLHILYHAAHETICGVDMMKELRRHGYRLGPGTLYPILHHLEENGFLSQATEIVAGKRRKNYRLTKKGHRLLVEAQHKLRELTAEVVEGHTPRIPVEKKRPLAGTHSGDRAPQVATGTGIRRKR